MPVVTATTSSSTGRWPFNSGCVHADWYQAGVVVMEDGNRRHALHTANQHIAFSGEAFSTYARARFEA